MTDQRLGVNAPDGSERPISAGSALQTDVALGRASRQPTVSRIERGHVGMSLNAVRAVGQDLEVRVELGRVGGPATSTDC